MNKMKLSRSNPRRSNVQVRIKNRKAQMLTPEQAAEEDRRARDKAILDRSIRFHSHIASQLCFGGRDPHSPSLIKFDEGRYALEIEHPNLPHPTPWIEIEMGKMFAYVTNYRRRLVDFHPKGPDFTLLSNESIAPVICPPVAVGRYRPMQLKSLTVQRLGMLERLVDLDHAIREALLLKKFGLLPEGYWFSIQGTVRRWSYVLRHTHSIEPIR